MHWVPLGLLSTVLVFAPACLALTAVHDVRVTVSDNTALPIESLQILAHVDGPIIRVVLDTVVRYVLRPQKSQWGATAEGTFEVGLPSGASPFLLAFGREQEVSGRGSHFVAYGPASNLTSDSVVEARNEALASVRGARMAPTSLASRAFRDTVSRNVDPAILEGGAGTGGSFSTRVFPLDPGELHRIVFGYDLPLYHDGMGLGFDLNLPDTYHGLQEEKKQENHHEKMIPQLSVRADIISTKPFSLPNTNGTSLVIPGREKEKDDIDLGPEKRYHHIVLTDSDQRVHRVELDAESIPSAFPRLGTSPLAMGCIDDIHHFAASVRIPDEVPSGVMTATSSHVIFAVETSFTTAQNVGAMERYSEITKAILEGDSNIDKFNVLMFDVGTQWLFPGGWVANEAGNRKRVVEAFQNVLLEGASDLHMALLDSTSPPSIVGDLLEDVGRSDVFLLSSGAATWGEMSPNIIVADLMEESLGRVHSYHVGASGNPSLLRKISRATSGIHVGGIDSGSTFNNSLASRHLEPQIIVESVQVDDALDIVVEDSPKLLQPGQVVRLAWRSIGPDARTLRIKIAGSVQELVAEFEQPTLCTDQAKRAYGVISAGVLEESLPLSEEATRSVPLHYRVVGQTASLVMLESESDYHMYDIQASYPYVTVQDVVPSQVVRDVAAENLGIVRSPRESLQRIVKDIEASGTTIVLLNSTLRMLEAMPEVSLDINFPDSGGKRKKDSTFSSLDRLRGKRHRELHRELTAATSENGTPEASYDAWTLESEARGRAGSQIGALRALTSLLAQSPADVVLRRDVALSAIKMGFPSASFVAFKQVAASRPWEPLSYIQMAKGAQAAGLPDLATILFEVSLAGMWEERFLDFKKVAAMLYARHLHLVNADAGVGLKSSKEGAIYATERESEVRAWYEVPARASLVAILTWNQDNTDVDLHITEPSGEECFYSNPRTESGGYLSGDVTDGFGPEIYILPNGKPGGMYDTDVEVFAENPNRLSAPIKMLVEVVKDWGWSTEEYISKTLVQKREKDRDTVAVVKLSKEKKGSPLRVTSKGRPSYTASPSQQRWIRTGDSSESLEYQVSGMDELGGAATSEILLLDVVPLSLGVASAWGEMLPLVQRGTTIPTKRTKLFSTSQENQTDFVVEIYQGERALVKDNKLIGKVECHGISHAPRGIPQIEVTFEIDANGEIIVFACEKNTMHCEKQNIERNILSEEEMEDMVLDAEESAEDDALVRRLALARYNLESYLGSLLRTLLTSDMIIKGDAKRLRDAILSCFAWIDENASSGPEEFVSKHEEIQFLANVIVGTEHDEWEQEL
eukprot:CAMPEP_0197436386 /NCGR_PEP_ID=MMETSP1175-20131217/3840_1 /TAXON_ID=1003142 /ORGANISM="Triceratium dubium, Strain CCMP147" /LENGTH=1316 /DNA_ID=CAMNT_0042965657 /DNA_START=78 /DNA_END=4028 /DNA_ORIENTATION=-